MKTHGFSCSQDKKQLRFYYVYRSIKQRCSNSKDGDFGSYGGRGIKNEWNSFEEFMKDMWNSFLSHAKNHDISNTFIERIDNNGNYAPDNCRWATRAEQNLNRRSNVIVRYGNKDLPLITWCDILGLKYETVQKRIKKLGWDPRSAFETPIRNYTKI